LSHPSNDSGEQPLVEPFVELYRAGSLFEADELACKLEESGIAAQVENTMLQGGLGELPPGWHTLPKVTVPKSRLADARQILQRIQDAAASMASSDDCCLSCKTPMLNLDTCPRCGWSWSTDGQIVETDPSPCEDIARSEQTPTPLNDGDETSDSMSVGLDSNARSSRDLWAELSVVMAVSVIPSLLGALQSIYEPLAQSYASGAISLLVFSTCAVWVVIYLVRNNRESLSDFGVVRPQFADVIVGILIVPFVDLMWVIYWAFIPLSVEITPQTELVLPSSTLDHVLMVISELANAFHEEFVFRAYLITRLYPLLKFRRRAIVVAAAIFASYHIYQGSLAVGGIFLFGLSFGVMWLLFRRLWPLVIGHALSNIVIQVFDWW